MTEFIKKSTFTIILATLVLVSCNYNRYKTQPDIWDNLDFKTNEPIKNMYASPSELHLMTDDEFIRVGNQNQLIERRVFTDLPSHFYGRPSMSQYVFAWVVTQDYPNPAEDPTVPGDESIDVDRIELHLTKTEKSVYFRLDEFADDQGIIFKPEEFARYSTAFNDTGDLFLLPTLNSTDDTYSFFLFDVKLNLNKTDFEGTGIVFNKRIDLPLDDIIEDIMNTSYVNGFFYVNTKSGTYRIDPNTGDYIVVHDTWTLNTFQHGDNIYTTGINEFDFSMSKDNGETFEQVGTSKLKYVEVANDKVISQEQLGLAWHLADDDMLDIEELRVNKAFEDDGASYWNIKHFYGRYYISIQKEVYFLEELETD